ncbi:uncharacterized protein LOC130892344 isoform X1 [Diorhabda carinulata]|uniref:uncharacterized protein LOC130892344 isoform X1 n=1 Tax=Diorhabda carinulata TaxID=1163345 RepID=UPI0025A0A008|nr:uncharacterized protein LOC130892344 isoform X1 [Diorhabda carinulata]
MEDSFVNTLLTLYKVEKWKEILKLNENSDNLNALKLLWVWPEEKNFKFIKNLVKDLGYKGILSLGCGCGLLEWLINQSTGLPVLGYEINREWWESKYSSFKFIKLNYINQLNEHSLDPNYALLFCYFNNKKSFQDYVNNYKGHLIFIIGPGCDVPRHTEPQPFSADFGTTDWHLYCYQEVKTTGDFIAAFIREEK